jgi:hypothetical protein
MHDDLLSEYETGLLGGVDRIGAAARLPARLQTHYALWRPNSRRRAMNRLASAQVTSKRCVFFFSPR